MIERRRRKLCYYFFLAKSKVSSLLINLSDSKAQSNKIWFIRRLFVNFGEYPEKSKKEKKLLMKT
jgi:hypothetical protein